MIKLQNEGIFCGNVTVGAPIGRPKRFNLLGFFVETKCVSYPTLRAANDRPYSSNPLLCICRFGKDLKHS